MNTTVSTLRHYNQTVRRQRQREQPEGSKREVTVNIKRKFLSKTMEAGKLWDGILKLLNYNNNSNNLVNPISDKLNFEINKKFKQFQINKS